MMDDVVTSLPRETPWQMLVATFFTSLLHPTSLIFGGIAGWFAGAGKRSLWVAVALIVTVPLALYYLFAMLLSPYGAIVAATGDSLLGWRLQLFVPSYLGTLAAMMILFFPFRNRRIANRQRAAMMEVAG